MINFAITSIIAFLVLETLLFFSLRFFRRDFQWLILKSIDNKPLVDKNKIDKFISYSYDAEIGWIRKPNTSKAEKIISQGQSNVNKEQTINFSIDSVGSRNNIEHAHLPVKIACYGDSFAFSRHVADNETWEWYLSEFTNTNVLNFGVGNYGFDQSILRFKREHPKHNAAITIIGVVPETICRIQSVWKHYTEYGNLLGFKPRFIKEFDDLRFFPNIIDSADKLYNYYDYLEDIQKNDYFYKNKFKKDLLHFPYSLTLIKNIKRNIPLLAALILKKFSFCKDLPWNIILKENFKYCRNQYRNEKAVDLFLELIRYYRDIAQEMQTKPVFVFFPYLNDLEYARKYGSYYSEFCNKAKKEILFLDLTEPFSKEPNWDFLYNNDFYGGHLSRYGNRKAALFINEFLKNNT